DARAVVVIAEHAAATDADAHAIRTVLALRRALPDVSGHIVVEVAEEENCALVEMIGGSKVEPILDRDVIGRLMNQSFRQHGLAHVYNSLLAFDFDEFYFSEWPQFHGKTFAEVA